MLDGGDVAAAVAGRLCGGVSTGVVGQQGRLEGRSDAAALRLRCCPWPRPAGGPAAASCGQLLSTGAFPARTRAARRRPPAQMWRASPPSRRGYASSKTFSASYTAYARAGARRAGPAQPLASHKRPLGLDSVRLGARAELGERLAVVARRSRRQRRRGDLRGDRAHESSPQRSGGEAACARGACASCSFAAERRVGRDFEPALARPGQAEAGSHGGQRGGITGRRPHR
jgi:hypothetical protein